MTAAIATRIIPENSTKYLREGIKAEAYIYPGKRYPVAAMGYKGNSVKRAFCLGFYTKEAAEHYVNSWLDVQANKATERAEKRAKKAEFVTTLKVGDILVHSWGWEQTNINFYQVTEVLKGGKSVRLREIEQTREFTGDMTGTCLPVRDKFKGPEFRKAVRAGWKEGSNFINMEHGCMSDWDGKPESWSSYA